MCLMILVLWILICLSQPIHAAGIGYAGDFPASTAEFSTAHLTVGGQQRDMWVYAPTSIINPPLLIFFSGTGGTLENSTLDEIGKEYVKAFADREGVAVVFPMPRSIDKADWDHPAEGYLYWETSRQGEVYSSFSGESANPDLLLVSAIIDEAERVYNIDSNRVYLNGFSSGAFFSYFAAAVLHEKIAAFAESGGGLVLSVTTSGEPFCSPTVSSGPAGQVRSCLDSGWAPNTCVSGGAQARPIAVNAVDWVPPAFIRAHDDDDSVPFAHSCNLAQTLQLNGVEHEIQVVHQGGGHVLGEGFWEASWSFMKSKTLERAFQKAADKVFDYGERSYAEYFGPVGSISENGLGYYYRHYPAYDSYLGYKDRAIYYYLPSLGLREAGSLHDYLTLIKTVQ